MGPEVARPLYWAVIAATVLGTVGLATRLAWSVVALAGLGLWVALWGTYFWF